MDQGQALLTEVHFDEGLFIIFWYLFYSVL